MAGPDGLLLPELLGVLVVELAHLHVGGFRLHRHFVFHHLVDGHVNAGIAAEAVHGHAAVRQRLLELLAVGKLLLHFLQVGFDLRLGDGDVAGPNLLAERRVGDQLIERAAQDFVAPLVGQRLAGAQFHVADQAVELRLGHVFPVDPRQNGWQLRRHRLDGLGFRCGQGSGGRGSLLGRRFVIGRGIAAGRSGDEYAGGQN
ncbi:MAG: hypothetical protein H0X67_11590 [Acidobacteria bacterium]|nr:hypothetical protein [Acidobacteriota bacterium]